MTIPKEQALLAQGVLGCLALARRGLALGALSAVSAVPVFGPVGILCRRRRRRSVSATPMPSSRWG
ncbi:MULTISPECIES: hypothetical protein [unclassified Nocardioides]|uniref:hypothetical protein n=1 Tax=unclassified Nocardioides TaxID=2615069 RepID=UPI0006F49125|nr:MULTISPECIES: hypothetical protein [unclassified Nocardioides]KRA31050.1 hypothetical protein ASD81_16280 [Nocardioides sp. Root614]KRA87670.1 hypothetical protein ASD84_16550 [Nocardioides sp. Root682]